MLSIGSFGYLWQNVLIIINEYMNSLLPGAWTLIKESIAFYKQNFKKLFPLFLVPFILYVLQALNGFLMEGIEKPGDINSGVVLQFALAIIILIVLGVIYFYANIASLKGAVEAIKGEYVDVKTTYTKTKSLFWPFVLVSLIVGCVSVGATALFIIPGIILSVFTIFAATAFFFDDKRGFKSLVTSWYYVQGNWWKVLGRLIVLFLIFAVIGIVYLALGVLLYWVTGHAFTFEDAGMFMAALEEGAVATTVTFGIFQAIGQFIYITLISPVTIFFLIKLYQALKANKPAEIPEAEAKKKKGWLIAYLVIGIIAPIIFVMSMVALGFLASQSRALEQSKQINSLPVTLQTTPEGVFENKTNGYSIKLPKGWEGVSTGEDTYVFYDSAETNPLTIQIKTTTEQGVDFSVAANQKTVRDNIVNLFKAGGAEIIQVNEKENTIDYRIKREDGTLRGRMKLVSDGAVLHGVIVLGENEAWATQSAPLIQAVSTFKTI